jgi:hypothetical protein
MEAMQFDPLFKKIIDLRLQNYTYEEIAELTAPIRQSGTPLSIERLKQIQSIAVRKLKQYFEFKKSKSPSLLFCIVKGLIILVYFVAPEKYLETISTLIPYNSWKQRAI